MTVDARFYETLAPVTVAELAGLTGAELRRATFGERRIRHAVSLAHADLDAVAFCADRKHVGALTASRAGAVFAGADEVSAAPETCAVLVCAFPQAAWANAARRLHRPRVHPAASAAVHPSAQIADDVRIAPGVVVGPDAAIGRGSCLGPGAVIGPGVQIGRDCQVGANAVVGFALIGDCVTILAGAMIGEAGFGVTVGANGLIDVPQLGRVLLQDGVTIGAGSCVDRGAFEDTVIGENSKIDNLVQIAHNVVIGRNCVLAAHTGVSGSVTIGEGCQLGGRVGLADHITIGAGARLAAAAGVMHNVPDGETWGGVPARPMSRWLRETAWLSRSANRRSKGRDDR